jgi:hypothetical protein
LHQGSLKATLFRDMEGVPAALIEARNLRAAVPAQPDPEAAVATLAVTSGAGAAVRTEDVDMTAESDPTDQLGLF